MELRQRFDEGVDYKMLKNSSTLDLEPHLNKKKRKRNIICPAFMFLLHYSLRLCQTAVESVKMLARLLS